MLREISEIYGGMFTYIPDPTNLGTAFVNGIANIMTTSAYDVRLKVSFPEGLKIEKLIAGDFPGTIEKKEKRSAEINLGSIRFGQDMDVLVKLKAGKEPGVPKTVAVELQYES